MIKSIQLSVLGLSIACLLTVTGCDMFGSKDDKTKETSGETATTKKAPINVDEVCTDKNIPMNLEKALKNKLVQQSTAVVVAQESDIDLDTDKVTDESNKIAVSISDVKAVEGAKVSENGLVSCQANVSLELPEDMVSRANEVYKANNQDDDILEANRIKDEAFTFMVNTNVKENNLQLLGQSALLGVVSNTLANSSLKAQGLSKKSTTKNTSSASSSTAKQGVATTAQQRAAAEKRAQQRALKRRQAAAAKKRRAQQARAKAQQQQAQAKAKPQQKAVPNQQAKAQQKTATNQQAKAQQQAVPKKQPQTKPQQKAVPKKNANENAVIEAQRAKEGIKENKQLKPVAPAKTATPSANNSNDIDVVIVEENGTY